MSDIKWLIFLAAIYSCIQDPPSIQDRNPASSYSYKVISYENNAIECRGYFDDTDAQGTLLETIPLGRDGQAPVRICGEEIENFQNGAITY